MPKRVLSGLSVGRIIGSVLLLAFSLIDEILSDFFSNEQDAKAMQRKREKEKTWDIEVMTMMRQGLSDETKHKPNSDCLRTWIRLLSQSDENRDEPCI